MKVIKVALVSIAASAMISSQASATDSLQPVTLKGYNPEAIAVVDAESISNLLYPSGMQLPTMYGDLLDLVPYNGQTIDVNQTTTFLQINFPQPDNSYTYAEYKAAERFVVLSARKREELAGALLGDVTLSDAVPVVADLSKFRATYSEVQSALEECAGSTMINDSDPSSLSNEGYQLLAHSELEGRPLSNGQANWYSDTYLLEYTSSGVSATLKKVFGLSELNSTISFEWDNTLGLPVASTVDRTALEKFKHSMATLPVDVDDEPDDESVSDARQDFVEQEKSKREPVSEDLRLSDDQKLANETVSNVSHLYTDQDAVSSKHRSLLDLLTLCAVVFVMIYGSYKFIADFIEKMRDPMRRFR